MKVRFDSLNRFEVPKFYVCNPGCVYNEGALSNTIGALSDTTDEELVLNFNTTSELNFRLNKVRREDPEEERYTHKLYKAIQNRRLIFVEDVGFFVIRDVTDGYEGGLHYKDVRAESCEYEISQKALPYIEDGTYKFQELLEIIVSSIPLWKINNVNLDIANKYRTFEDVSVDANALSFLLENMQDAYECIFEFDTINRLINVYDQNYYVEQTDIHITKKDLIESIEINENSDDLYTAISVQGDENLNISPVNPLGGNVIYNFSYYLDWMTPSLSVKVKGWQDLVKSKEKEYSSINLSYYELMSDKSDYTAEIKKLNTQIDMYQRMRDNIVAEGDTSSVESYNKVIEENGGVPVGVQVEIRDTILAVEQLIADAKYELSFVQKDLSSTESSIKTVQDQISEIRDSLSVLSYFTDGEYAELSNYIFEGNYTDEYIAVTDSMDYKERFEQMRTLYARAVSRLTKVSEPTQEFSIDVENFLFAKEFESWSSQLKTGCLINVELDTNDIATLFLSNITVNYDDKDLSMTFGNRFNRFDPKAMFNNVLGSIKKSSNSINYIKDILYPVKNGEIGVLREAIESSNILTKNAALTTANQEILIDDTGILGRKKLNGDGYDPKQIKITNQTIVFTDDGWETAKTALGNFYFNNPVTGQTEEKYGIIADTLIGSLVLSEQVGIYNASNSISLDENGFILTSDYTSSATPSKNVFTIQKVQPDGSYTKQLYIDDDGNLVLNGSISINTSSGDSTSLENVGISESEVKGLIAEREKVIVKKAEDEDGDLEDLLKSYIDGQDSANFESAQGWVKETYDSQLASIQTNLSNYQAEVGQYLTFNENNGLTIGAKNSPFKTVIDNKMMSFWMTDTNNTSYKVAYFEGTQLYVPNAVITNSLMFGKFYFCPHKNDKGFSITWQD